MAPTSPVRPARRAAARRQRIIDSSDDEKENETPLADVDEEDEFTPAPKAARKPARRKTQDPTTTPALTSRLSHVNIKSEDPEELDVFTPPPSNAPARRIPATGRRSVRAGRKSQTPAVVDAPATATEPGIQLPTMPDSTEQEPAQPLEGPNVAREDGIDETSNEDSKAEVKQHKPDDPTENSEADAIEQVAASVQAEPAPSTKVEPVKAPSEKPMDIVIRTRAKPTSMAQEPATPTARLVITYLILENFKSYAGRQEVGPFHASFSSVVGPNGSGKSNVIDSLLFVFGFRASKMRQGKISSLIHNSAGHPDLEYCEVQVHFQKVLDLPNGNKEVIPDSALIVSRRAFKNNSSKYYINGSSSDFTTVTTLLREQGIDLDHKRFLILQGEVESIAQMKPKAANEHDDGLLEYLEDIIGTSKYKTPIEQSATETEELNEICIEKNTRVQHVEKEKKALEGKKDAALAYIKDENDLTIKQSQLWQIFVHECNDNVQVTEEAIGQLQDQLKGELESHAGAEQEIKDLQKQHASETKAFQHMEQSTQALLKQLAKSDKESVKFAEKKKHLMTKVNKLEKTKGTSQSSLNETAAQLQRLADDAERNTSRLSEIESTLQEEERELNTVRENLTGKTRGISEQISKKQKALEPWTEQINEKKSAITVAQSELSMLQERDEAGAQAVADLKERIEQLQHDKSQKADEVAEHEKEQTALQKETLRLQKQLDKISSKEVDVRSKVSTARQKADEARASLSSSQTQGNVLAGLTRLKESGRISGFHGRLGNLGSIDQKYDVAISTACPALDNLVVDSVDVGQKCIDYLRKNNLGRANFILLDRLAQRDLSEIDTPEGTPRLFDLVRPKNEMFRPAFYSVLQNTLVAKDLEQANRVAYGAKRWRVVTLDGQLIDKSGTMSGGGTRVAKGAMSSKLAADTTKEQVAKLEAERDVEETSLVDVQQEQQSLTDSLRGIQSRLPNFETDIQKANLEMESIDRNIADATRRESELSTGKADSGSDKARVTALQKQITKQEKELASLQENTVELEGEINALQEQIMEIGGVKLRGQKAKVDSLKEQMESLIEEMSGDEVTRAKTEKSRTKLEKSIADSEKELASVQRELEKLDEEVQSQIKEQSGSRREAEEAQDALETKKDELATLKTDLDQRTAELNETRGVELEMRNKLEENQKILSENQKRLKYWEDKLSKLTLQNVADLENPDNTPDDQPQQADADGDTSMMSSPSSQIPTLTRDELSDLDKTTLKGAIATLEERTSNASVDLSVLSDYRRRAEEHAARTSDLTTALASRDAARRRSEDLRRLRLEGFMEGFSAISLRLKEMYQMITMGGNAELELVDSLDPFSEGILFSVMPPKKSWKNISNLSGGEKTLSSLALVFALHHYKPTPLYVMDEIDAALDFRNVSIVASYIRERTRNAQFVVISLRNNMFELASRLVGVYKVNHMTKSVTVENRDYIKRS
ncbi:MAG: hypothetical protein M1828_003883 [Chrysothrix sp. TS-e1954]|nr:MAG: hypothetical protein M1828_003883 [Chrysothrix sp. TS-e1954]